MSCFSTIFFFCITLVSYPLFAEQWTHVSWTKTYHFNRHDFHHNQNGITVQKDAVTPFTQLLVSWNAALPECGYFRFFLNVFDEKTHHWLPYTIYEWGNGINRSFATKDSRSHAQYVHVRFEGSPGQLYKKFKVTVEAVEGASLAALRHIAVCASDFSHFKPEKVTLITAAMHRTKRYAQVSGVPCISQHHAAFPESASWCSPTSVAQLIEYYTQVPVDLPTFAQQVFDQKLGAYGSWPFNTAQAGVYLPNHLCYVTRLHSIKNLIKFVASGYPVIVSVCCAQPLPGAPQAYPQGHLMLVVGYDLKKNEIICHDTAERDVMQMLKHYPLEPFMRAWERRQRLAYLMLPFWHGNSGVSP